MRNRIAVLIASLVCLLLGVVAASAQTPGQIATVAGGSPGSVFGPNSLGITVLTNISSVDAIAKRPLTGKFDGATGDLTNIGGVDLGAKATVFRYSGQVCFADQD